MRHFLNLRTMVLTAGLTLAGLAFSTSDATAGTYYKSSYRSFGHSGRYVWKTFWVNKRVPKVKWVTYCDDYGREYSKKKVFWKRIKVPVRKKVWVRY